VGDIVGLDVGPGGLVVVVSGVGTGVGAAVGAAAGAAVGGRAPGGVGGGVGCAPAAGLISSALSSCSVSRIPSPAARAEAATRAKNSSGVLILSRIQGSLRIVRVESLLLVQEIHI
jgi:hypothetical protein